MQTSTTIVENITEIPQKAKNGTDIWSTDTTVGIYPKEC
jgi:hypothetical protein